MAWQRVPRVEQGPNAYTRGVMRTSRPVPYRAALWTKPEGPTLSNRRSHLVGRFLRPCNNDMDRGGRDPRIRTGHLGGTTGKVSQSPAPACLPRLAVPDWRTTLPRRLNLESIPFSPAHHRAPALTLIQAFQRVLRKSYATATMNERGGGPMRVALRRFVRLSHMHI